MRLTGRLFIVLVLLVQPALAAPRLGVISTDGRTVTAAAEIAVKAAGGSAEIANAPPNTNLTITATLQPDAAHEGKRVDLYTVIREDSGFFMRNLSGAFVPWSGRVADLQPAKESVLFNAGTTLEVYSGSFSSPGKKLVYVGFMPSGAGYLVYTPSPAPFTVEEQQINVSALSYYGDHIEADVVQSRCIACHVSGGLAKDSALQLQRGDSEVTESNFDVLKALVADKGAAHVLGKASGGNGHGGGVQLPTGSSDYNSLATLVNLFAGGGNSVKVPASEFFSGVTLQSRPETVRRAAIHVAGRAPTQAELDAVANGDEATLRSTLRGLLQGDGFHRFLLDGTNDRLLTDGTPGLAIDGGYNQWQTYQQLLYNHIRNLVAGGMSLSAARTENLNYGTAIDQSIRRSVGELVAFVVENDRSYQEIVTGDYMMMNPPMNQAFNGGATFRNPSDWNEFQPARLRDYFLPDPLAQYERDFVLGGARLVVGSRYREPWRHSGLLNHPAFLKRYPSTATNRNRARARWTLFHFMDLDIEKSVQRPMDAAVLADRDNPTLNNPACAACHEPMDPVAGAFQNYGDTGLWRQWGTDSLDPDYKIPPAGTGTNYRQGDLWYRDMRSPGFMGQAITSTDDSIRDLGQRIAREAAFARATVKFWWPSVMSSEVLLAPAVQTDVDYQARLTAFQAQSVAIEQFAAGFMKDYNLKNLLVEMMMSPWFRAAAAAPSDKRDAYLIAHVGVEKLLTPERLSRKTQALTGYNWGYEEFPFKYYPAQNNLDHGYRALFGGIDSFGITRRKRDMTPMMSSVAQSFAFEAACPVVLKEFMLPEASRRLFGGIDASMTPATHPDQIKQKLVELHATLLGNYYTTGSPAITALFDLFNETWRTKIQNRASTNIATAGLCNWNSDDRFLDGLGYTGPVRQPNAQGSNFYEWDSAAIQQFLRPGATDPQYTKISWIVVMHYFLSHYQYLYE